MRAIPQLLLYARTAVLTCSQRSYARKSLPLDESDFVLLVGSKVIHRLQRCLTRLPKPDRTPEHSSTASITRVCSSPSLLVQAVQTSCCADRARMVHGDSSLVHAPIAAQLLPATVSWQRGLGTPSPGAWTGHIRDSMLGAAADLSKRPSAERLPSICENKCVTWTSACSAGGSSSLYTAPALTEDGPSPQGWRSWLTSAWREIKAL